MFIRAKMTGGCTWRQPNTCYRTLPKFSQISWSPNHMKLMRYCSTPTQVSGMSIVRQFLWWDTPTDTPKRSPPKNWARSAEVRTTWDLWDIIQDHPRYQEWALPDTLSGGIPPTDRQTYRQTYQNWARSAEIRTTWNLWDIIQHHPRYQEWALPDSFSGGLPLTDTPKWSPPKFIKVRWSPNQTKPMGCCSTPPQVSEMSIARQFLWWGTPGRHPQKLR